MLNYNHYQILKIECDKNGQPLEEIDDNYIKEKYEDRLIDFFINQKQWQYVNCKLPKITRNLSVEERRERKNKSNQILESEEAENIRIEAENYIAQITRGLGIDERLELIKSKIQNGTKEESLLEAYVEAYSKLDTQDKRNCYNKELQQISLNQKLKSQHINVELKEIDDEYIYGDLMTERKRLPTEILYANNQGMIIALDNEMSYQYYRYKETDRISLIRSRAIMKHDELQKYLILRRKNGKYNESDSFYAEASIAEKLRRKPRNKKEIEEKAEYIKALITSHEMISRKGKAYVGYIEKTENGYECVQNKKIDMMVQNFINKQKQNIEKRQGEEQWQK